MQEDKKKKLDFMNNYEIDKKKIKPKIQKFRD